MALTRDFRDTIRERARRDASFRRALFQEAVELLLAGDVETGRNLMRNYITTDCRDDRFLISCHPD